jgi:hypothetical protein
MWLQERDSRTSISSSLTKIAGRVQEDEAW